MKWARFAFLGNCVHKRDEEEAEEQAEMRKMKVAEIMEQKMKS